MAFVYQLRSDQFLTMPLLVALDTYLRKYPLPQFTECAVCFVHVYDESLSLGRVRDYDNLETKHICSKLKLFTGYLHR